MEQHPCLYIFSIARFGHWTRKTASSNQRVPRRPVWTLGWHSKVSDYKYSTLPCLYDFSASPRLGMLLSLIGFGYDLNSNSEVSGSSRKQQ